MDLDNFETVTTYRPRFEEPLWRTPSETLRAFPAPKARFLAPWPALNKATRDRGLPTGAAIVVQGEPDAGKSGFVIQLGLSIGLDHGAPVWIYASDGGEESTAARVGGLLGLNIDRLEDRDPEEVARLDQMLSDRRIFLINEASEAANLEVVVQKAEQVDPEVPHVLVVDSIQETPPRGATDPSERDTVISNVRILRRARQSKVPWLIVATSEVVKSSFSAKNETQRSRKIAAGSETGKVGYLPTLVVHLSGNPAIAPDFGRADIVKNKLGPKLTFALRLEEATLALQEIDCAGGSEEDQEKARAVDDADRIAMERKVLAAIDAAGAPPGYPGVTERSLVRACGVGRQNLKLWAAVASLKSQDLMEDIPGPNRSTCYRRRVAG